MPNVTQVPNSQPRPSLSGALQRAFQSDDDGSLELGQVVDAIQDKGFGLLLVFLAIPSALPLPAVGYSTPFGLMLALLGLQMLAGRHTPWLPARARRLNLGPKLSQAIVSTGSTIFRRLEAWIRPRQQWMTRGLGKRMMAMLVIVMALLMCLPIPSTNTFPAGVIFLIGVGMTEEDGLFCSGAVVLGILAAAIYVVPVYLLVTFIAEHGFVGGIEAITQLMESWKDAIKDALTGLFGSE